MSSARRESPSAEIERTADLRYSGQSYELNVPWQPRGIARPFHQAHHKIYGYSDPERAVEIVAVRVKATIRVSKPAIRREDPGKAKAAGKTAGERTRRGAPRKAG